MEGLKEGPPLAWRNLWRWRDEGPMEDGGTHGDGDGGFAGYLICQSVPHVKIIHSY